MKKFLIALLVLILVLPPATFAHLGEEKGEEIYDVSIAITGVSLVDDLNLFFIGNADVLFDYEIKPTYQTHDVITGVTTDSVNIGDNQSKTFTDKIIYQHEICGCDQDFEINISALDYSPLQSFALDSFLAGLDLSESFLTGGTTGLSIAVLGKLINAGVDYLLTLGLTEEEARALAEADLRDDSEFLGRAQDDHSTGCDLLEETFTNSILLEEVENGDVTYKITKTPTGNYCRGGEETGANVGFSPTITPNSESTPAPTSVPTTIPTQPDPEPTEEALPACIPATGKVLVNGEYYCPTSSVPSGEGCTCIPDYEWAYPNDLCQGCTKTDKNKCLAATKQAIDWATGTYDPVLSFVGDNQILWDAGEGSCKNMNAVIADFTRDLNESIPMFNEQCVNLKLIEGRESSRGNCYIEFLFQYKN